MNKMNIFKLMLCVVSFSTVAVANESAVAVASENDPFTTPVQNGMPANLPAFTDAEGREIGAIGGGENPNDVSFDENYDLFAALVGADLGDESFASDDGDASLNPNDVSFYPLGNSFDGDTTFEGDSTFGFSIDDIGYDSSLNLSAISVN